ncbi:MAG TPA: DUF2155 domain-containing protein [Stellaceae bacterium]|nr:DUF2155 domain-containing protein [Stellaceae bacterium]
MTGLSAAVAAPVLAAEPMIPEPMIVEPMALLQGLDKTTARVSQFETALDKPVQFGDLSIVVRACEKNPPDERPENAAFLQIFELHPGQPQTRVFSGWMFSSSPALSALEDPIYDVNVLECKAAPAPAAATAPAPATKSPR